MVLSINGFEMRAALERLGWYVDRQKGGHAVMRHPDIPGKIVVPMHRPDREVGTVRSIIGQAGISEQRLREVM